MTQRASVQLPDAGVALSTHGRAVHVIIDQGLKSFNVKNDTLKAISQFHHDVRVSSSVDQTALALSEDGKTLALADDNGQICVLALPRFELLFRGTLHTQGITAISISPDGRLACSTGRDRLAIVWDTRSGRIIQTIHPISAGFGATDVKHSSSKRNVRALRFAASAAYLFAGEGSRDGGWVSVWRHKRDSASAKPYVACSTAHVCNDALTGISVDDAGRFVAVSSSEGHVSVLRWDGSILIRLWSSEPSFFSFRRPDPPHALPITGMGFSVSGRFLIAASADRSMTVWDVNGRSGVNSLTWLLFAVVSVIFFAIIILLRSRVSLRTNNGRIDLPGIANTSGGLMSENSGTIDSDKRERNNVLETRGTRKLEERVHTKWWQCSIDRMRWDDICINDNVKFIFSGQESPGNFVTASPKETIEASSDELLDTWSQSSPEATRRRSSHTSQRQIGKNIRHVGRKIVEDQMLNEAGQHERFRESRYAENTEYNCMQTPAFHSTWIVDENSNSHRKREIVPSSNVDQDSFSNEWHHHGRDDARIATPVSGANDESKEDEPAINTSTNMDEILANAESTTRVSRLEKEETNSTSFTSESNISSTMGPESNMGDRSTVNTGAVKDNTADIAGERGTSNMYYSPRIYHGRKKIGRERQWKEYGSKGSAGERNWANIKSRDVYPYETVTIDGHHQKAAKGFSEQTDGKNMMNEETEPVPNVEDSIDDKIQSTAKKIEMQDTTDLNARGNLKSDDPKLTDVRMDTYANKQRGNEESSKTCVSHGPTAVHLASGFGDFPKLDKHQVYSEAVSRHGVNRKHAQGLKWLQGDTCYRRTRPMWDTVNSVQKSMEGASGSESNVEKTDFVADVTGRMSSHLNQNGKALEDETDENMARSNGEHPSRLERPQHWDNRMFPTENENDRVQSQKKRNTRVCSPIQLILKLPECLTGADSNIELSSQMGAGKTSGGPLVDVNEESSGRKVEKSVYYHIDVENQAVGDAQHHFTMTEGDTRAEVISEGATDNIVLTTLVDDLGDGHNFLEGNHGQPLKFSTGERLSVSSTICARPEWLLWERSDDICVENAERTPRRLRRGRK